MKKAHTELADKRCNYPGCNKRIKQRLVDIKENINLCYKHHCIKEAKRGHTINTRPRSKRILKELPVKSFA